MQIYLFSFKPKNYTTGLTLTFNEKPSKEQVVSHIEKLKEKTGNVNFKDLCTRCLASIDTWGFSNRDGVHLWCDKGMSEYSSFGKTLVKTLNVITL
jgi:hypothetical protein